MQTAGRLCWAFAVLAPGSSVLVGTHLFRSAADGTASVKLPGGTYAITAAKVHYVGAATSIHVKNVP